MVHAVYHQLYGMICKFFNFIHVDFDIPLDLRMN